MRGRLGHASSGTRGTKPPPLATEGQQQFFGARVTAQPQKAMGQDAAPQIGVKFTCHIRWQARGLGVRVECGKKSLEMVGNVRRESAR